MKSFINSFFNRDGFWYYSQYALPAVSQNVTAQNQNIADTGRFFTSFDSTKIYYEVRGTGDAVVVLVHGFIVNGQS